MLFNFATVLIFVAGAAFFVLAILLVGSFLRVFRMTGTSLRSLAGTISKFLRPFALIFSITSSSIGSPAE